MEIDNGERDALELLQAVYRNAEVPLSVRMRAASIALPYEKPKLVVTAMVSGEDFATMLDKAIERSGTAMKQIEHQPAPHSNERRRG